MLSQQLLNGLALGMIYALLAVGYSLVFGILRLVNFSHGSVYAFGAHICLMFISMNFGLLPGIVLSIVFTGILGVLIDMTALKPLRKNEIYSNSSFNNYNRNFLYYSKWFDVDIWG